MKYLYTTCCIVLTIASGCSAFRAQERAFPSRNALNSTVKVLAYNSDRTVAEKGAGVIVSTDGLIVTCHHVITHAVTIEVTLFCGVTTRAEVVTSLPENDLAVLKVNRHFPHYAKFGRTAELQPGERVYAIGNPKMLDFSLTTGIVSGLNRRIGAIAHPDAVERFIQTDAPVNSGCSGGPLFNSRGELVGILIAIVSQSNRYEGYSFAQPADMVLHVLSGLGLCKGPHLRQNIVSPSK